MATIVTRSGKGSALSFTEMDNNFSNLNTDKIELANLSVGAEASASGDGGIAYNNSTGVFTYTPPTAGGIGAIALTALSVGAEGAASGDGNLAYNNTTGVFTYTPPTIEGLGGVAADSTPQLGGNLDVQGNGITTSTVNQDLSLSANGTGKITVDGGTGLDMKAAALITTSTAATDLEIGATGIVTFSTEANFDAGISESVYVSTTTTGVYAPDAANSSIHYVVLTGSMTINGFTNAAAGQTISFLFDGTGGTYTLTLGANILQAGGSVALTSGGMDVVTITCVDDVTPTYIATAVNDFQ